MSALGARHDVIDLDQSDADPFADQCALVANHLAKSDEKISAHQISIATDLPIRAVSAALHELVQRRRAERVHCPDGILRYRPRALAALDNQPMRVRVAGALEEATEPLKVSAIRELVFGAPVDAYSKKAARVSSALYEMKDKLGIVGCIGMSTARVWYLRGSRADPNQRTSAAPEFSSTIQGGAQ